MTIPIPRNRAISEIMLTVRCTNGATRNTTDDGERQTIIESVEEIKLSAGSRVFAHYDGQTCRDWETYRTGRTPYFKDTMTGGVAQEAVFPLVFNRYAGDPYCALPAPIYDSLELYVKHDFTVSATGGFATGTAKYDLYADVLPPMGTPELQNLRVIETKKKQDYTTVASGIEPIDLTIDPTRQLRRLLVSCYEKAIAEGTDITTVELQVNSETKVSDDWNRYQWQNAQDSHLKYAQNITLDPAADADIYYTKVPNVEPQFIATAAGSEDAYLTVSGDNVTLTGVAAGEGGELRCGSQVIPATIIMDFDKDLSLRNLIPQGVKDLQVLLTQAAAGGAVQVHEQSLARA